MHYSRIMPVVNGARYFTSTAVLLNEILKLVICVAVVIRDKNREGIPWSIHSPRAEIFGGDAWKLTIPAALYTVRAPLFAKKLIFYAYSFKIICNTSQSRILMQRHFKSRINSKFSPPRYSV